MLRPQADEVQLDLMLDYASNVALYPAFQAYFREHQPKLLAIWGKNDPFFLPAGAEAYKRDLPNAEVRFLDTGTSRWKHTRLKSPRRSAPFSKPIRRPVVPCPWAHSKHAPPLRAQHGCQCEGFERPTLMTASSGTRVVPDDEKVGKCLS